MRTLRAAAIPAARTHLERDVDGELTLPPRPSDDADPERIDAHGDRIEHLIERAEAITSEARAARAESLLAAGSMTGSSPSARAAGTVRVQPASGDATRGHAERGTDEPDKPAHRDRQERHAEATRLLARLPESVDHEQYEEIQRLAERHAGPSGGGRSGLALRTAVRRAQQVHERAVADRRQAIELRSGLAPFLDQTRAARTDAALGAVIEGGAPLSDALRRDAAAAAEECSREADRRTAAAAAAEAFRQLGYEVEEGFETLVVDQGVAHATKPGWDGYAVRWRVRDDEMRFHVVGERSRVATAAGVSVRDQEIQQALCDDLPDFREGVHHAGIELSVDELHAPGEVPVQEVDALPWSRAADVEQRRERSRGRQR